MAEKWTAAEDLTTQGAEFQKGTTGRVLHSNDMAAILNALEADKAALLEALEEIMAPSGWSNASSIVADHRRIAAEALARLRSEGAEVNLEVRSE